MGKICSVVGCKNSYGIKPNLRFHRFPQDKYLRQLWIDSMKRPNWEPSKYSHICSDHFEMDDYIGCGKLKSNIVPKIDSAEVLMEEVASMHTDHCDVSNETSSNNIIHCDCNAGNELDPLNQIPVTFIKKEPGISEEPIIGTSVVGTSFSNAPIAESHLPLDTSELVDVLMNFPNLRKTIGTQTTENTTFESIAENQTKGKLRKKIRCLNQIVNRRTKQIEILKNSLAVQSSKVSPDNLFEEFHKHISQTIRQAIELNDSVAPKVGGKHYKFDQNMKNFSLTLYSYSPKSYEYISKFMPLPASRTLRQWLKENNCAPEKLPENNFTSEILPENSPLTNEASDSP